MDVVGMAEGKHPSPTDETVFVPKYGFRHRAVLVVAPVMAALALLLAVNKGQEDPEIYLVAAFFVLCAVVIPFAMVRRIRFGGEIVIERYILPPRRFSYSDVQDIGVSSIKMKKGHLSLYEMQIVDELHAIFEQVMQRGQMSEGQIEGELAAKEIISWMAAVYALIASVVIYLVLAFLRLPWRLPTGRWMFLLVFIVVFPVCYFIVRRRAMRPDEPTQ
jgi:4-amino-4-deoxy-L-arabinose transferase-like glycosyltransferase